MKIQDADFTDFRQNSDFVKYVYSFYGEGGIYEDMFEIPVSNINEIEFVFQNARRNDPNFWSAEDTICREILRDFLLDARGVKDLEHQSYIDRNPLFRF